MRALVTGGGGFVGGALARRLVDDGWDVRSFARGDYPELADAGIEARRGDLADEAAVREAVGGCDVVFHVAAKAGVWGPYEDYRLANVVGTENVIAACREHGVARLVHTSTPSVVYDGRDQEGLDESAPYPFEYLCAYPETKALAERSVLDANGNDLTTVALRPHLVWGPGDRHLVPRILERGRAGQLRRVGRRPCLVDASYIDNVVDAHVAAASTDAAACGGRAYFIANDEPVPIAELIDRILAAGGQPPVARTVPVGLAYAAGAMLEGIYRVLGKSDEPRMTRFVALQLSTAHWFDLSAAKRDLGWAPRVSTDEGMERLAAWLRGTGRAS
jgi:nucleoside-diphosphate-sugar epimerase